MAKENSGNVIDADLGTVAQVLGIGLRTAQRYAQMGMFECIDIRGKAGKKYYDLRACVQGYIRHVREEYESRAERQDADTLKAEKLQAEIDLKKSQAELHQFKTKLTRGEYLTVEEVQDDYERFFIVLKKFVQAIPARVGGLLTGYVQAVVQRRIEKDLQAEVAQMLRAFVVAGRTHETP